MVHPGGGAPRGAGVGGGHQRLDLHRHGTAPLQGHGGAGARYLGAGGGQEQARGVRQPHDAPLTQVEAADLIGGAVAVLDGPQQPQAGVTVPLELGDDVDQVLQDPGPGDPAVFGHMTHEQHRDIALLGHRDECTGHGPHLGDAPGTALDLR